MIEQVIKENIMDIIGKAIDDAVMEATMCGVHDMEAAVSAVTDNYDMDKIELSVDDIVSEVLKEVVSRYV